MMGLWASGLRSLRPLASTHSVPRLTTPSFSPHINPFKKNSKLKQNISWFGLSFVQISCRKIRSFPFLIDFHSFLPKRARKYHFKFIFSIYFQKCQMKTAHHNGRPIIMCGPGEVWIWTQIWSHNLLYVFVTTSENFSKIIPTYEIENDEELSETTSLQ